MWRGFLPPGVGFAVALFFSQAAAVPNAKDVRIEHVTATGPGCPRGTGSVVIASTVPDGPADFFEVIFDAFEVQKGPGLPAAARKKHCIIDVALRVPRGFRFSLADVYYDGYASLPLGTTGILSSEYMFPSSSHRMLTSRELNGPFVGGFTKEATLSPVSRAFSRCTTRFAINLKATLELKGPPDDVAYMTVDLTTRHLTQTWRMHWEACS